MRSILTRAGLLRILRAQASKAGFATVVLLIFGGLLAPSTVSTGAILTMLPFVAILAVAALLTPPDPMSQIGLALPTIILYEISIWAARMIERGRERDRLAREKEEDDSSASEAG